MNRYRLALVVLALVLAASLKPGSALAASPWSGHWETAYVHGDPADFATLDFSGASRTFLVRLHDAIPGDAWNNPDCHGPADAWGVGLLTDATHMTVGMLWRCASDGSFHASVRYFRIGGIDDTNPANDGVVFCSGASDSTCGLVWHRAP